MCVKFSLTKRMVIRDSLVITISLKLKSALEHSGALHLQRPLEHVEGHQVHHWLQHQRCTMDSLTCLMHSTGFTLPSTTSLVLQEAGHGPHQRLHRHHCGPPRKNHSTDDAISSEDQGDGSGLQKGHVPSSSPAHGRSSCESGLLLQVRPPSASLKLSDCWTVKVPWIFVLDGIDITNWIDWLNIYAWLL